MPKPEIENMILKLKSELQAKYPGFRGIYLFGSQARGEAHEDSDIDLTITFDGDVDSKFKDSVTDMVYEFELRYLVLLDTHIYNIGDILMPRTPFRANVKKEGIFYGL